MPSPAAVLTHDVGVAPSRVHALSETVASLRRELELILSRSHRRQKEEANRIALLGVRDVPLASVWHAGTDTT